MLKNKIMEEIHASNLEQALMIAIGERKRYEKENGYTSDSALLAGWKKNLKDLRNNKLEIKY